MSKQLGKGLEELFNDNSYLKEIDENETTKELQLSRLIPNPHQPRKHFDETQLLELSESIKLHGVFTPIIVTFDGFKYVIVAGERRFRASKMAGLQTIPAIIREYSEKDMMEIALLENIQRQDLTVIEVAESYKNIMERSGVTHEEFANRMGKSRSQITNMIGLLNLPTQVKNLINDNSISYGHARVLSKIKSEEKVLSLAEKVVNDKLTVRELESLTQKEDKKNNIKRKVEKKYTTYEKQLKDVFSESKISDTKIVINFKSEEELAKIIKRILK